MTETAEAIRIVTAQIQRELESGRRSSRLDAHDLVDVLLAIADQLDPPLGNPTGGTAPSKRPRQPTR